MVIQVIITIIINMANITITKYKLKTNHLYLAIFLLNSNLLIIGSLPRLIADFYMIPVNRIVTQLSKNPKINSHQIQQWQTHTVLSLSWVNDPQYWANASQLSFYQIRYLGLNRRLLQTTQQQIQQSLLLSPVNSFLWYQSAVIDWILQDPIQIVIDKLIWSIVIGKYELTHLLPRLKCCLYLLNHFNRNQKLLIKQQVLIAWTISPTVFSQTFARDIKSRYEIRQLLYETHPSIFAAMNYEFNKIAP